MEEEQFDERAIIRRLADQVNPLHSPCVYVPLSTCSRAIPNKPSTHLVHIKRRPTSHFIMHTWQGVYGVVKVQII